MADAEDPSYVELVTNIANAATEYWNNLEPDSCSLASIRTSLAENMHFSSSDVAFPLIFAGLIFSVRKLITIFILHCSKNWQFKATDQKKLPESIFLVLMYSTFWIWECKIVLDFDFLHDPAATFRNWPVKRDEPIPSDVYWLYVSVLGFYIQALFACLCVDEKRKDTEVMVLHHVCTIFLISFSLGMRFWAIGCLVLFCHDICDIFLDLSKIFLYIQNRSNCSKACSVMCEIFKTMGFITFVLSWIVFRFHLYPRKAIYAVAYHSTVVLDGGPPVYLFYNFLLISIQLMHIYWFYFILKLLVRIAVGDKSLTDNREYTPTEQKKTK